MFLWFWTTPNNKQGLLSYANLQAILTIKGSVFCHAEADSS
jgi:hypothetical protein